jgi:PAS domain S-box-containing protein
VLGAEQLPLVFLGDKDYPPVAYLEDGIAKGMDVDLAKALAAPIRREIRIELMDWNLAQEKVLKGEADGLLGLSISDERRRVFDFAEPTFTREFGLVVRRGEMSIHDAGDLKGRNVGVTAGGFPRKFLETQPGVNLVLINNYQDGFDRLVAGTIDAMAADLWVAACLMEKGGIRGVIIVGKPFTTAQGAIAVGKGNVDLLTEINRGISALKADGKISKIQNDWRPQEMVFASREQIRGKVTQGVGTIMIILLGVMAIWIFTLEKQMRIRRKAESALRTSEERFQLAVRGSTDGLWDRNILTNEVFFSDRYRELLGHSADEFPGDFASFESCLHPDDKDRVLKMVTAHLEQRQPYDAEYRLRTKSGEYRWFRGRGQAIWNKQGQAVRMAGSITDITERKRSEEQVNLLQMITMDVAAAADLPSALEVVLRRVCEKTGWALGQAWVPNRDKTGLECCPAWFAPNAALEDFRVSSTGTSFPPGIGLPGRVWESRQPVWVQDVTLDTNFPRAEAARKSGLKAGLAVPILSGDEVIAVLEFFLSEPRSEDERLVNVITAVAAQIGLVMERKRAEEELRESEAQFRAIFENAAIGVSLANLSGRLVKCNPALQHLLGYTEAELLGMTFAEITHPDDVQADLRLYRGLVAGEFKDYQIEKRYLRKNRQAVWVRLTVSLVRPPGGEPQFAIGMVEDITGRKRAEALTNTQMHVLEMIAASKPMTETLNALLRMIEAQSREMLCSVLLLDRDGLHVRHGAAPSLPLEYLKAIDGAAIGPCAGSCGTAAFRREAVFVADIASDPLWADYKHLALPHGLLACWSTPIFDAQRNVLGTFAIYYRKRGLPDERHLQLIDVATHTAAVCIAKHRADEALRESEEQFRAVVEFSPECVAVAVEERLVYLNPAGAKLIGAKDPAEVIGRSVYDFSSPEMREIVKERRRLVLASGVASPPIAGPMVRLDGSPVFVEGIAVPFVYRGKPALLNLIRDISNRKRAEAERTESVARERRAREEFTHKLIVSQETERRRIAGELHDSLGQNLLLAKNRAQLALSSGPVSPETREQLEGIRDLAAQAIADVRQIAHALHPYQLDHLGLTRAVQAMIENAAQSTNIVFEHKLDPVDEVFSPELATNLYRVVQECLTNALKHAQARSVRIQLERDVRHVRLLVKDDGRGFTPEQQSDGSSPGLGLKHMAERVRILNGTVQINSTPTTGTAIEVLIPIPGDK